jgi:hypothetical protein
LSSSYDARYDVCGDGLQCMDLFFTTSPHDSTFVTATNQWDSKTSHPHTKQNFLIIEPLAFL